MKPKHNEQEPTKDIWW